MANNKENKDYYIGLDIGTNSVGWAVADSDYNLLKANRKSLWGVRLFEDAKTAAERRVFRALRRRHQRTLQRLSLLQGIFKPQIEKIDPTFFIRLNESSYHKEDRYENFAHTLFNESQYSDSHFFKKYPTIFHLRSSLIHNPQQAIDIRELYLAIYSILKNRGHFLFKGENMESSTSLSSMLTDLINSLQNTTSCSLSLIEDKKIIGNTLKIQTKREKKQKLKEIFLITRESDAEIEDDVKGITKQLIEALAGSPFNLSDLLENEELKESDFDKIDFSNENFENLKNQIEQILTPEEFLLIETLEAIHNWTLLSDILHEKEYLSDAKVEIYQQHGEDLRSLKKLIRLYEKGNYHKAFKSVTESNNYVNYIGNISKQNSSKKTVSKSKCSQEDVCKYFKNLLEPHKNENDSLLIEILNKIENKSLLPKLRVRDNRVIPHQLHLKELTKIIDNAKIQFPFISIPDEDGYKPVDKIISMLTFRIPYYVGPLNTSHKEKDGKEGFAWMVRRSGVTGPIYPWNFDNMVDTNASAEIFIRRMTNKCTYLYGEDVIPKHSLLYSKYMVLNELNNLKINGEAISVELKNQLYDELFLKSGKKKITLTLLKKFLLHNNIINKGDETTIEGIDNGFTNSLSSRIDFSHYLEDNILSEDQIEQIITWKALYGDDNIILTMKITKELGEHLTEEQIVDIIKMIRAYKGWGRLSKRLLKEIYHEDPITKEVRSIITMMTETNENLMQLLSNTYDFSAEIQHINDEALVNNAFNYESIVEPLNVSPPVKRQIWQTLLIIKELKKIMKVAPKKIFVEVAREKGEKKRTTSRKERLLKLYDSCKNDIQFNSQLISSLETKTDTELRNDRLYFYYTQMGKCLYSGQTIDIANLNDPQYYDIDHIYPQSLVKDDSLNNRALVSSQHNGLKSNTYPIDASWQEKMKNYWSMLLSKDLISKEKYYRLTRTTELSTEELSSFINRQLVETRQSTKVVTTLLKSLFKEDNTEIIYVKAPNVSSFRKDFDIKKSRTVNDHHHAHDAYLNIVVGNVYHTKFTSNAQIFIKELRERNTSPYNIRKLFFYDVIRNSNVAWVADKYINNNDRTKKDQRQNETGTITTIRKTLNNHQILITRQVVEGRGALFDLQPLKKKEGLIPLKGSNIILQNTEKYGGYNSQKTAYFFIVEHTVKENRVQTILTVPVIKAEKFKADKNEILHYCEKVLKLVKPTILINKILLHETIKTKNFKMSLSGITGKQIVAKNEIQLIIGQSYYDYIAVIEKYLSLIEKTKRDEIVENSEMLANDLIITKEKNTALYLQFLEKERDTIYVSRPANQVKFLEKNQSLFENLPILEQCKTLILLINLFTCTSVNADLSSLGGGKSAGIVKFANTIKKNDNFTIINASPTGIFTKEVRINNL